MHTARIILAAWLGIGLAGCAVLQRIPDDGLYAGELCVATGSSPPNCGHAAVSLSNGRVKVGVSDFTYDLLLQQGQLDLMLVHGTTLVDVFSAPYSWHGRSLRFLDAERRVSYEVRF